MFTAPSGTVQLYSYLHFYKCVFYLKFLLDLVIALFKMPTFSQLLYA